MCAICLCIHGMGMCICVYVHRLVCTWNRCMFAGECYTSLCVAGVSGMFVCNVCVCAWHMHVCVHKYLGTSPLLRVKFILWLG